MQNELQVLFSRRRVSWRLRKGIMQVGQGVSCTREKKRGFIELEGSSSSMMSSISSMYRMSGI